MHPDELNPFYLAKGIQHVDHSSALFSQGRGIDSLTMYILPGLLPFPLSLDLTQYTVGTVTDRFHFAPDWI
jgi:hypothetical protein